MMKSLISEKLKREKNLRFSEIFSLFIFSDIKFKSDMNHDIIISKLKYRQIGRMKSNC